MASSIQFSPFTSIFDHKPAGTIVVGKPGSGKSFFLISVAVNALMMNQKFYAIDPKNDLGVIAKQFPDKVEYIDINNVKPGALDPFSVFEEIDATTISAVTSIICGGLSSEEIVAITPIIQDYVNMATRPNSIRPTFKTFTDYLYASDSDVARSVATKLKINEKSKYGKLIFSEDSVKALDFNEQSKIISLLGMDLPQTMDMSKVSEDQKFNAAIVFIICKLLKNMLSHDKYPRLFIMDEAHIAFQSPAFKTIIDEFLVLGRSLRIATALASQNITHFDKTISQHIANKFCFSSSATEARAFVDMFSNDIDMSTNVDAIVRAIGSFEQGTCYYIDSSNKSGYIQIKSPIVENMLANNS